jgi:hypothetical protein
MTSPLAGLPLRYLIGCDSDPHPELQAGTVTELGFGIGPQHGLSIAYGNFLCQHSERDCGPYLDREGTAADYGEDVPDPSKLGFDKNLRLQFQLARSQGHKYVELDNPDDEHFSIDDIIRGVELAAQFGLGVIAKNPGLLPDCIKYVVHPNIFGSIVEKGAGSPADMHALRVKSGKPTLPVWFVFFGRAKPIAQECVRAIEAGDYRNMGVTYSSAGEYGSSTDVLLPVSA